MRKISDQKVFKYPARFFLIITLLMTFIISCMSCGKIKLFKYTEQIKIPGFEEVITSDTLWKKSKSPYYIQHNIFIVEDATLTIEPGVKIYLSPGVLIKCHGRIVAAGKNESPIYFSPISEIPWNRIECFGGRYDESGQLPVNIFHYCIVEGGGGFTFRAAGADVKGCKFRNNVSPPLRLEFSSGQIVENEIYENMAQRESPYRNGAGIMVYTDKAVLIADNVVHDNFSSGSSNGGGGGIFAAAYETGDISILRNTIYGNLSDRNGGGIYAYSCHIEDNQVRYNSTSDSGGGIYAVQSTLVNNRVRQNQALRGGGIYAENSRMEYNLIIENTARSGLGGGLFYFGKDEIINNTFIKNGARDQKGDTIVVSGNPRITGNNIISEYGYALMTQNPRLSMDLDASGNYWGTADDETISGLIYDWLDDLEVGLVNYEKFSENWIIHAPDAPYSWVAPQPPPERQPNQLYGRIDRNRILGRFGRVSFEVIENVLIPEDITVQILPGTHLNIAPDVNIRVRGKLMLEGDKENPVYLTGDSEAPWGNLLFENYGVFKGVDAAKATSGQPETDENSFLSYCIIENGLGIMMEKTGARVQDCIIRQNYGTGIKIHDASVTITGCQISDNISSSNGGGIYTYGSKRVSIDSNQILNNLTEENGGGIFAFSENADMTANLTGNRVEGNQAQGDGGGIWASTSTIVNNQIYSNTSEGNGGGLFSAFSLVEGNYLATNQSAQGGGIFSENSSSFYRNRIEKNSITGSLGGGVCLNFLPMNDNKNQIFYKNLVKDNSAIGDAAVGGIYLNGFLEIEESNIFQNKTIQLYNANSIDTGPVKAINCYWGTTNPDEIEKLIFDNHDDPNLSQAVYDPFSKALINIDLPGNPD